MSRDPCSCAHSAQEWKPPEDLEAFVRGVTLRLAEELGTHEAIRLVPALVRALTGARMQPSERRLREEMVQAGQHLAGLGLVSGMSGNLSIRESEDTVLITPGGRRKGELAPDDMVRIDLRGNVLSGGLSPSSEFRVHLMVYRMRPEVHAVVHTHPPYATAFAAAGTPLDGQVLAEALLVLGPQVPVVPYGMPSTWDLAEQLEPWLPNHQAFLLANHGALALGTNLAEAVQRTEVMEFLARVLLHARLLGGERPLSAQELARIAARVAPGAYRG